MNIDISDIKSFITVAECKSISAAALRLDHLQSNITAKIKKIENHYKKQLFIRKPKGVELTDLGYQVYEQYKKILFTWEETEQKINQQESRLRFGTNTSLGAMRFYPSLDQLYQTYPNLRITLRTGETSLLEQAILEGNLDFAYVLGHPRQKQLQYLLQKQDELVLIGKQVMNAEGFADCLHHQTVLYASEQCCYASTLKTVCEQLQIQTAGSTQINDLEALIKFTQLGMGVSLLARSLLDKFQVQYYRALPEEHRHIGLYLISRPDHVFSPIEKQFLGLHEQMEA